MVFETNKISYANINFIITGSWFTSFDFILYQLSYFQIAILAASINSKHFYFAGPPFGRQINKPLYLEKVICLIILTSKLSSTFFFAKNFIQQIGSDQFIFLSR